MDESNQPQRGQIGRVSNRLVLLIVACTMAGFVTFGLEVTAVLGVVTPRRPATTSNAATPAATASPIAQAPTATPVATATPVPTPTPDLHALTVDNITRSIQDNRYLVAGLLLDNLQVSIDGDQVSVSTRPPGDENWLFKQGAWLALVASKAVLSGWYPTVKGLSVQVLTEFTSTTGQNSVEPATTLSISMATAKSFSYQGLAERAQGDPSVIYYDADAYNVHLGLWKNVDSKTRGLISFPIKVAS
jgi:hypothetical protein